MSMPSDATPERILQRLDWHVVRRLDGLLQGDYRTLFYGAGIDLADLREYQPEDDIRYIDWNVTARMDTPYVRQYVEDRDITGWFLLDLSPSLEFGTLQKSKHAMLVDFVTTLARLLTRHGNRVGALLYGKGVERMIPARAGRTHVLQLLHAMQNRPQASAAAAPTSTRLTDLLQAGATFIRRRSTIFVVSDFISEPGWEKPLAQLAQRHEVLAVRLLDPLERELPDLGLIPLRDAETGQELWVDTHDRGFRHRFAQLAAQRDDQLRAALTRAGVDALELSTEGELLNAIVRFIELRRQRLRAASGGGVPSHLRKSA